MNRFIAPALATAAALLTGGQALAGYTRFDARDENGSTITPLSAATMLNSSSMEKAFKANFTAGVGTETFESKAAGALAPLALNFVDAATGSDFVATLTGGAGIVADVPSGTADLGRYSVPVDPGATPGQANGRKYWDVDPGFGTFEIKFDQAIAAFGFYGIDIGDFAGGGVSLTLLNKAGGAITSFDVPAASSFRSAEGSVLFMGILASAEADDFWGVRFTTSSPNEFYGFDNFTVAERCQIAGSTAPVNCGGGNGGTTPLPGTVALLGAALLGLGASRRRRA